ncbi:MAG: hypothetical protein ABI778_10750, partial [Ignavibacteriota bacterium]
MLLLFASGSLAAQWTLIAPNLLGTQQIETGVITHKSGITWAGSIRSVFMSPDSGRTWINRSPPILGRDNLDAITFFDNNIGVVCTNLGSIFRTDDRGLSWREIHKAQYAYSAAFLGSTDNIMIASGPGGTIDITRDGGVTWQPSYYPGGGVPEVCPLLGGSAMALAGLTPGGPYHIIRTADYGATWQTMPGVTDYDTYSFVVNPCDPNFICVANEKGTISGNRQSQIYTSQDAGNTFTLSETFPRPYFCGSVVLTTKAVFTQSVASGIRRSTDRGASWQAIGGPSATFDTRLVCAISSNILIAADNNGSLWMTRNSGGDSLLNISPYESLSISPIELFAKDTLFSCDSPAVGMINLFGVLCNYPKIIAQKFSGADSDDYRIILPLGDSLHGRDSVVLSFRPHGSGPQSGNFIIILEDSTQIAIPLKGYGKDITFVQAKTADISIDTIGGSAFVPLRFEGFPQTEDIEVILHYDQRLIYKNSFSLSGRSFDVAGESWPGRAKLMI